MISNQLQHNLWVRRRDSYLAFSFVTSWYQLCMINSQKQELRTLYEESLSIYIYIYIYIKLINYVKSMVRKENTCASRSVLFSSGLKQECWYRSRVLVILPREGIREKVLSFEPIIATWFKAIYQTHLREQWRYEANKVALAITSCDELRYKHFIYIYSKK